MEFSQEFLSNLIENNKLSEFIPRCLPVKKRTSGGLMFHCPFHPDKTPSFFVSTSEELFHCFGCGKSGNVINFVMLKENLNFKDAIEYLCGLSGLTMPDETLDFKNNRQLIYDLNKHAADLFNRNLYLPESKDALAYLKKRNIKTETIEKFKLGYSGNSEKFCKYFENLGYNKKDLMSAGFINERGKNKFLNRIMIPIQNEKGNVVGFGARNLSENQKYAKYINTKETEVFKKRECLFGLNFAKNSGSKEIILVEGFFDAIMLHQNGIDNAVASLGTALTESQLKLIEKYTEELIFCFDQDYAGMCALERASKLATLKTELKIKVMSLPSVKDADQYVNKFGKESFLEVYNNRTAFLDYKIANIKKNYRESELENKAKEIESLVKLFSNSKNSLKGELCVNYILKNFEISNNFLNKNQKKTKISEINQKSLKGHALKIYRSERLLLAFLLNKPENKKWVKNKIKENYFENAMHMNILNQILREENDQENIIPVVDPIQCPISEQIFKEKEKLHQERNKIIEEYSNISEVKVAELEKVIALLEKNLCFKKISSLIKNRNNKNV